MERINNAFSDYILWKIILIKHKQIIHCSQQDEYDFYIKKIMQQKYTNKFLIKHKNDAYAYFFYTIYPAINFAL